MASVYPQKLFSRVVLGHSTIPSILNVTYDSYCSNGTSSTGKSSGDCSDVQINDRVSLGFPCKHATGPTRYLNNSVPGTSRRKQKLTWGQAGEKAMVASSQLLPLNTT